MSSNNTSSPDAAATGQSESGPVVGGRNAGQMGKYGSFLPEDYVQRRRELRANSVHLMLFVVVLAGVAGAFLVTNRQWHAVKAEQQAINAQYAAERDKIEQLKKLEVQKVEMLEKAEVTAGLIERIPRSILLAELINRMPERATIIELGMKSRRIREEVAKDPAGGPKPQSLSAKPIPGASGADAADKDKPVIRPRPPRLEFSLAITGLAATDADVADFHARLKDCPLLDRVDLVSSSATKIDETLVRKFKIEAQLKPSADARRIEPLSVPRMRRPITANVDAK